MQKELSAEAMHVRIVIGKEKPVCQQEEETEEQPEKVPILSSGVSGAPESLVQAVQPRREEEEGR